MCKEVKWFCWLVTDFLFYAQIWKLDFFIFTLNLIVIVLIALKHSIEILTEEILIHFPTTIFSVFIFHPTMQVYFSLPHTYFFISQNKMKKVTIENCFFFECARFSVTYNGIRQRYTNSKSKEKQDHFALIQQQQWK